LLQAELHKLNNFLSVYVLGSGGTKSLLLQAELAKFNKFLSVYALAENPWAENHRKHSPVPACLAQPAKRKQVRSRKFCPIVDQTASESNFKLTSST
jgi:hypothetical protein